MESSSKANEKKINIFMRLPIIRHVRAIFELIIVFFWRHTLKGGAFIQPSEDDIKEIYNIWYGFEGTYEAQKVLPPNAIFLKLGPKKTLFQDFEEINHKP